MSVGFGVWGSGLVEFTGLCGFMSEGFRVWGLRVSGLRVEGVAEV